MSREKDILINLDSDVIIGKAAESIQRSQKF
jgi:hypothetical protein